MKKRWILICICLIIPLFIGGCWNRRELDKMGIVTAIGIDRGVDSKIDYTVQIVRTSAIKSSSESGSGSEKAYYVLSSRGDTVFDAVRNLVTKSGRKLYYPHNIVIVLGGDLAREGISEVLDLFSRDQEMRLLTWVLVTSGHAGDIVQADSLAESIPAREIEIMLKDAGVTSKAVAVHLLDLENELMSDSIHPVVGRVELFQTKYNGKSLVFEGAGVFRKDKLIDWIDPLTTRGYLWIQGKVKSGIITVADPKQENRCVSLEIKKANKKIKPYMEDGKLKFNLEISVESVVGERTGAGDLTDPEVIRVLEDEQRTAVENEVKEVIQEAQGKSRVDILGLGQETMRKFPKEWERLKDNWNEEFPNVDIEVSVQSKINNFGLRT